MMTEVRTILLAEDNPNDVELTLAALGENRLANEVVVAKDGTEGLDCLLRQSQYADRVPGNPALLVLAIRDRSHSRNHGYLPDEPE